MKNIIVAMILAAGLCACSDDLDVIVDMPNDVTLNELELGKFTHKIPDQGFSAKGYHENGIRFNTSRNADGTYSGFAYSNRSNRSFTWTSTQEALDSNIYSVYTRFPNGTGVYAVGCVKEEDAYFMLEKPTVVEHILVGNTTYDYLAMFYGNQFGDERRPQYNINMPLYSPRGIWYTYVPGGVRRMISRGDYFKLVIKGYRDGKETGSLDFYMLSRYADPEHPNWNRIVDDWFPVDLTSLGVVDKVAFTLESTDVEEGTGRMRTPAYFCLDGIRLRQL